MGVEVGRVSSILTYAPGFVIKGDDIILGLQTERPLSRAVNPFAGFRNAEQACKAYGYDIGDSVREEFNYRTTHNTGVFRTYTDTMKKARHAGILTGLPDAYSRGRLIGDYRRLALYGMDRLIENTTGIKTFIAENPTTCVVIGTGRSLDNIPVLPEGIINISRQRQERL